MPGNTTAEHSWAYAGLEAYAHWYWHIHGYVSLVICTFGIPTNIVNVIILTRKSMRTPINCILTGIAVSDILTMLSYMPFAVHFYIMFGLERTPEKYSFGWTLFLGIHAGVSVTTHTVSIWLAVCMSIVRYVFLRSKGTGSMNLDYQKTCVLIVVIYVLSILVFIPNYMLTVVEPVLDISNTTMYQLKGLAIGGDDSAMNVLNTWVFIIIGKLAPCLLISVFGGLLLHALQKSKKRTKNLKGTTCGDRMKQHKRTTTMLLVIILMFIIAELPSAILISTSVFMDTFFSEVYMLVGDTLDAVALLNNAANFIMYCTMSQQFRDCLCEIISKMFRCREDKALYKFIGQHRTSTTVL